MAEHYVTREGFEKLQKEIDFLSTVRRREISKAIEHARSLGDLSENAEYDAAKDAQGLNEKRIADLKNQLGSARLIDNSTIPKDEARLGATVTVKNLNANKEFIYRLVSELESDFASGKISVTSPVGKGLLGAKVGDTVEIKVPAGMLRIEVVKIEREGD